MEKMKSEKSSPQKSAPFKPSSKFIKSAVEEYLDRGGKITKHTTDTGYYNNLIGK
ncbi:hypothetical protein KKA14_20710 [bacterium]|nr:hypothetical protein [bacterium]